MERMSPYAEQRLEKLWLWRDSVDILGFPFSVWPPFQAGPRIVQCRRPPEGCQRAMNEFRLPPNAAPVAEWRLVYTS